MASSEIMSAAFAAIIGGPAYRGMMPLTTEASMTAKTRTITPDMRSRSRSAAGPTGASIRAKVHRAQAKAWERMRHSATGIV